MYRRLNLCQLSFKKGLERLAIMLAERNGGGDIEVVQEVCDMEKYRMPSLCFKSA